MIEIHDSSGLIDGIRKRIKDADLRSVIVGYGDLAGVFRGKRLLATAFARDPLQEVEFSDYIWALDVAAAIITPPADYQGWMPSWESGFADFAAVPDLSTFRVPPWLTQTGLVLCNLRLGGSTVPGDPREILRGVVSRAEAAGLHAIAAPEYEFFVYRDSRDDILEKAYSNLTPLFSRPAPYGVEQSDVDDAILSTVRDSLEGVGVPWSVSGIDGGAGQYEVNVPHVDMMVSADTALLYKYAVKTVFRLRGMTATFMARPQPDFGSSCHVHQSIWNASDENVFHDEGAEHGLSKTARQYIAGQLATLPAFDVLLAPHENSYRRFGPELAVGTTATWGFDNRTTALRVVGHGESATRVENRRAGADANPYLVMAANLAGGLYGIENALEPPDPIQHSAYSDDSLPQLSRSFDESIAAFESSDIARDFFGQDFVEYYAATRRWEREQSRLVPTDWERERLLLDA